MKISEALIEKSELLKINEQILNRIIRNAIVQEGEKPSEEVSVLLKILNDNFIKIEDLSLRIAKANSIVLTKTGIRIADAIIKKELLGKNIEIFRKIYESGDTNSARYSQSEIRKIRTFDLKEIQKNIDLLSKEYRVLDVNIQEANWNNNID